MAFAIASTAGTGTITASTANTTVTGTGTNFVAGDIGKQLIAGQAWAFITAVASTTSITTSRSLGNLTNAAYSLAAASSTVTQTGTDTGVINWNLGVLKTAIFPTLTTLDMGQNVLQVDGTFTLTAVNERITAGRYISVGAGGLFHVQGQNTSYADTPTMQVGVEARFTISATDSLGAFCWNSTNSSNPGIIRITDASVRIGVANSSQVIICSSSNFGRLQTRGSFAGLFRTTNADNRVRVISSGVCDFQANKTVLQFWLNIGTPQPNLKGLVPYLVDGPEVNMAAQTTAQLIEFDSYDYSAVLASAYPGAKFTLFAGPWVRHKNLRGGTTMSVRWQSTGSTSTGVMEFSRVCVITSLTPLGVAIPTAKIFTALANGPTNAQPKGFASPISYPAETLTASANASGVATFEPVYAVARSTQTENTGETAQASTRAVFRCSGVTPGAETNQVVALAYGYKKEFLSVPMSGDGDYTNTVALEFLSTTDKLEASAAAITGVAVNLTAKTIDVSVSRTVQAVYDRLQYSLVQTANAFIADTSSYVSGVLDVADFAFTVSGGTLSAGIIQTTGVITVTSSAAVSANLIGAVTNAGTISSVITGNVTNTGTLSGASITGNVSQATATDLSNVTINGNLTFNDGTTKSITLTNTVITGTVSNTGAGTITVILSGTSSVGTAGANVVAVVNRTITTSAATTFNIVARYGSGTYTDLGFFSGVTTKSFLVPVGQPLEIVMWSLGYVSNVRLIAATDPANYTAEMVSEPDVDTALDVSTFLSGIALTSSGSQFTATFNTDMDIPGVPELKAILHRMLGSEPALRSLLPPGAASTVAINADEVAILQPTVTLALGAANNVNIRGFINTSAATAIAPTYIINPRRADGLRIEIPLVKPAIDPAYLALEVWKAAARTLTADPGAAAHVTTQDLIGNRPTLAQIEASTTLAKEATSQLIKTKTDAIPSNPLLTTDARLNNLDATVSSRLAAGSTVDSNVTQVTGKIVIGTGTASDPWRPQ